MSAGAAAKRVRRIFISSPFSDLEDYRAAAKRAVAKFHQVYDDFSEWTSEPGSPLEVSVRRVQTSDLVVLLLAHRYGTPVREHGNKSITHFEFEAALAAGVAVRAFFVSADQPWVVSDVDPDPAPLNAFKAQVTTVCTPAYFSTPQSLEIELCRCFLEILIAEGLGPEAEMADLVRPSLIEELSASARGYFMVGEAEDTLPLALKVSTNRSKLVDFQKRLTRLVEASQVPTGQRIVKEVVRSAIDVATAHSRARWEAACDSIEEGSANSLFVVQGSLALSLLFSSILSRSVEDEGSSTRTRVVQPAHTLVALGPSGDSDEPAKYVPGRLAIGVTRRGQKHVLVMNQGVWAERRPYITEHILSIPGAFLCLRVDAQAYELPELQAIGEDLVARGARLFVLGQEISLDECNYSPDPVLTAG